MVPFSKSPSVSLAVIDSQSSIEMAAEVASKCERERARGMFALDGILLSVDVPCANQTERSELHKGMIKGG